MIQYVQSRKRNHYHNKYVQIYKGAFTKKPIKLCNTKMESCIRLKTTKVVVFDLDETIGSFHELYVLWSIIRDSVENNAEYFNELLDLYPEFFRYGILNILEFLSYKKKSEECSYIYIYTNNRCEFKDWVHLITQYLSNKVSPDVILFDKIISAFKINDKIVEFNRTTSNKTHVDFIKCTLLPRNTEICFIDNTEYDAMKHDKIYYIQPKSYHHHLSSDEILERLYCSGLYRKLAERGDVNELKRKLYDKFIFLSYSRAKMNDNIDIDILVTQKLMYHVKDFFYLTVRKPKTKKLKFKMGNFTRKKTNHS